MQSLRRLYNWTLSWADRPHGLLALFLISFAEASFFPIPPDPLLLLLCLGKPKRGPLFALVCTAGSVLGGMFGYLIGWQFFQLAGDRIIRFYGMEDEYAGLKEVFEANNFLTIFTAGLTPIPYKVFTIAAGAFRVNFLVFMLASLLSRGLRFLAQGLVIYRFGDRMKAIIEKWFEWLAFLFALLLVLGFVLVKWFF